MVKRVIWGLIALLMLQIPFCARADASWRAEEIPAVMEALERQQGYQVPAERRITPGRTGLSEAEGLDERRLNILLMSSDADSMRENFGKTEALFLLSIHLDTGEMRLLSLPAAALIQAEGLPVPIPLKYINCFGGPRLVMRTLNESLGLNIRKYCAVNMQAFSAGVDALQGVTLKLSPQEAEEMGVSHLLPRLNGKQAYQFVQSAKGSGAGGRAIRVMEAACEQLIQEFSLTTALNLARKMLPLIDSNLNILDIGRLMKAYLGGRSSMDSQAMEPTEWIGPDQRVAAHKYFYGEDAQ